MAEMDILDDIGGDVIATREPQAGEFVRRYMSAEKNRWADEQWKPPSPPPPPAPETVLGRDLFRKYHTQDEAEAFRRAIKMADDLADGDRDGSLDSLTDDQLKALEVIGQWYYFYYHPDKIFSLEEVTPIIGAAIKLGVYADNRTAVDMVASIEVAAAVEKKP